MNYSAYGEEMFAALEWKIRPDVWADLPRAVRGVCVATVRARNLRDWAVLAKDIDA